MAKIIRKNQRLFASTPGAQQVEQFGAFANGGPVYTTDPDVIQALPSFLIGWVDAILANNSPCVEDMNALFLVAFYQLAYIFQAGVSEWDTNTTYYIGSIAQDGLGNLYTSLTDNNQGNILTNVVNWAPKDAFQTGVKIPFYMAAAPLGWTLDASINDRFIRISSSAGGAVGGAFSNLPHTHPIPHTHNEGSLKALIGMNTVASTIGVTRTASGSTGTDTWATGGIGQNTTNNTTNYDTAVTGVTAGTNTANSSSSSGLTHDSGAHAYADFIICTKN